MEAAKSEAEVNVTLPPERLGEDVYKRQVKRYTGRCERSKFSSVTVQTVYSYGSPSSSYRV